MKIRWLVFALATFLAAALPASAKSFNYEYYDVDIVVNKDTTMDITEKLGYVFDGSFSEIYRGIPLDNLKCRGSSKNTCGGFELITVKELRDSMGQVIPRQDYSISIETDSETDERFFVLRWNFGQKRFDGKTTFPITIKYKVFGGVRLVGINYYFYWNTIPSSKGGVVKQSTVSINLPARELNREQLIIYGTNRNLTTNFAENKVKITATNLSADSDITVSYPILPENIFAPAKLQLNGDPYGQTLLLDGLEIGTTNLTLNYFPAGKHSLVAGFSGYNSRTIELDVAPGESRKIDIYLDPLPATQLLIVVNNILTISGCFTLPLILWLLFLRYRAKGRDRAQISTVVPEFSPPQNFRPYLIGSLINERVDRHDITGTLIDLAYRGHLKITELPQKNYRLTKLDSAAELNAVETELVKALFGGKTEVETKELTGKFAGKYNKIVDMVYAEMVQNGYFERSPRSTIATYLGCGGMLVAAGVVFTLAALMLAIAVIGKIGPFTFGLGVIIGGITMIGIARFMPAKTEVGSKALHKIRGFKMYLETADKHRLEMLGPTEFEKYLGYAIALGVSDTWAGKFASIYHSHPDWYETDNLDAWDVYIFSHRLNLFAGSMNSSYTIPASSASGGGWSGGSSFGGFSGGGGGGGFSGAR